MNLSNKICSVKNCNKVAFYYVTERKLFFCEDHKELAYKKAKASTKDYDDSKSARDRSYINDRNIDNLSKIK